VRSAVVCGDLLQRVVWSVVGGGIGVGLLLLMAGEGGAQTPPKVSAPTVKVSYGRQIRPLFEKQCLGCHSGPNAASGYRMESRDLLLKGGRHGIAVMPGSGGKSALVRYLTGEQMPRMPSGAPAWDKDTISLVRRWIEEGAAFDSAPMPAPSPVPAASIAASAVPASSSAVAPVTALAFSPDGRYLAAAGYRAVRLLDPATGVAVRTLSGPADQTLALAWRSDGAVLAAAGGVPGGAGEVILLDPATGRLLRTLAAKDGHTDAVNAVAWRPGTKELATGSLDKTVRIWDTETGRVLRVLKEHADAVLGLAFSADGKYLATASADRTAKLFDGATGKPLQTLSAHEDAVTSVAFRPDGSLMATVSADKTLRIWKVEPGRMQNPERVQREGDGILACAFSPDNAALAYGAANRTVKIFTGEAKDLRKVLSDAPDWMYSVAFSPDGKRLAAGSQNGVTLLWDVAEGKRLTPAAQTPNGKAAP
jgi:WD40 repeat protein